MKKFIIGFILCSVFSSAWSAEVINKDNSKAKKAAECAANLFTTGQLKTLFNQQADYESKGMMLTGASLLYLSAMYSSQDEAFQVYDEKQKDITSNMISAVGDGTSRAAIASFIMDNLVPANEKCLPAMKDYIAKKTILNQTMETPTGKALISEVIKKTYGSIKK